MSIQISNVPFISQLIKYPTGCESVSAVMALRYMGYPISVEEFIDQYLPLGRMPHELSDGTYAGDDPWLCFPGNPYTKDEGWGCFAPVLEEAISAYLKDQADAASRKGEADPGTQASFPIAEAVYNMRVPELCAEFIDHDIPVIFWATIEMAPPRESGRWITPAGREIRWISPMHCTLLTGYITGEEEGADPVTVHDRITHYIFNDPTSGENAVFSREEVERAYEAQGCQALVIRPVGE